MKSKNGSLALKYLDIGWSVFPVTSKKTPYLKEWKPYQTARPTRDEIKSWWTKWPNANVAVATGPISNLAVLDFDSRDALDCFKASVEDIPDTIISHTPRGFHYFFKYPEGGLPNAAHIMDEQVDLRGAGGYVIIPPSSAGKKVYEWNSINPIEDGLNDLLDMPENTLAYLRQNIKGKKGEKKNAKGWIGEVLLYGAKEGNRNDIATKVSGYYFRQFPLDKDGNLLRMRDWNKKNQPPLPDEELIKITNSIAEREGANTFGNLIGYTVANLKRLIYPDGRVKHQLFLEDFYEPLVLEASDVTNFNTFNQKFIDGMGRVIFKAVKKLDFLQQFDRLLQQAEVVEVDESETILGAIREIIDRRLESNSDDPANEIDNRPIVHDGFVMLKMTQLMRDLKMDNETKRLNRNEVALHLRQMGFDNNNNRTLRIGYGRDNSKSMKLWRTDNKSFKK